MVTFSIIDFDEFFEDVNIEFIVDNLSFQDCVRLKILITFNNLVNILYFFSFFFIYLLF